MRDAIQEKIVALNGEIEERRHAENERMRLSAILESTNDIVLMSSPDGRIFYMNSAGRELIGWEEQVSLEEKKLSDIHPEWAWQIIAEKAIPIATELRPLERGNRAAGTGMLGNPGFAGGHGTQEREGQCRIFFHHHAGYLWPQTSC